VKGKGDIPMESGHILDVFLVHDLTTNLLFMYQIYNTGGGRTIFFTPDDFEIHSLLEP